MFRTEHVGSLLRPESLLKAREGLAEGTVDAATLRGIEDEEVLAALRRQEEIGLDVVGDGEYRRTDFRAGFAAAVSGLREEVYERDWKGDSGAVAVQSRVWRVVDRVEQHSPIATEEARFLAAEAKRPYKVTLPSPGYIAERFYSAEAESPYPGVPELAAEFSRIIGDEIDKLIELGVPYVQLDNPGYASFLDEAARERIASKGRDPDVAFHEMLASDTAVLNQIKRADSTTVGLHICRGNNSSYWLHSGGYGPIAEELFATLPVDRFLLEFDDERSGGFECLELIPAGKVAVLGLISTKTPEIETVDALLGRLDEAAKHIAPDQLAISPQCGFASHAEGGNQLTLDDQYAKLSVAVETAARWFDK